MGNQRRAFGLLNDKFSVVRTEAGIYRNMHRADFGNGEHQVDPFRAIVQPDGDPLLRSNSRRHQATRDFVHPCRQGVKALPFAPKLQCIAPAPAGRRQSGEITHPGLFVPRYHLAVPPHSILQLAPPATAPPPNS